MRVVDLPLVKEQKRVRYLIAKNKIKGWQENNYLCFKLSEYCAYENQKPGRPISDSYPKGGDYGNSN